MNERTDSQPILSIADVSVEFRKVLALDRFSLRINPRELVALSGPNGAGKSTVLRAVIRQVAVASGRIEIAGRDANAEWHAVIPLIGYMPDKDDHFEELTGRRNLALFARLHGMPPARVDECLNRMNLCAAADRAVSSYSLGMRRRLLLARAILHQPRLLLLDEPLANLDDRGVEQVRDTLLGERERGAAVVLTTPHCGAADPFWDREIRLADGRIEP